jgi:hypothetical protein
MAEINLEISAYNDMRDDLETQLMGKWVLIHDRELIANYDSFDSAAQDAVLRFGRGPYLIRKVGAPPVSLPASVMFRPHHARS